VAEAEGGVIGFAALDAARGNVWALFVSPSAEGRGAGRALHYRLLAAAAGEGVERLWLTTGPDTRAAGFYRKLGWEPGGTADTGETRFERHVPARA
jgi:GNAT superfamily N-acetyltransferase